MTATDFWAAAGSGAPKPPRSFGFARQVLRFLWLRTSGATLIWGTIRLTYRHTKFRKRDVANVSAKKAPDLTPAMLEAGARVLSTYSREVDSPADYAADIFLAMVAASDPGASRP